MLHYFKFRQDLLDPAPARDVYVKRARGRGWPEECPPIRAANGFGFDLLANFDVTFVRRGRTWSVVRDVVIESDFRYAGSESSDGQPLVQQYAWFWEKGQKLPHVISDNVYREIANQVKVSSFLFLKTDPNELLLVSEVPNLRRKWRAMSALIETDWYPASYPWHVVIELDRDERRVTIKKGEPLARLVPVRRDAYFAGQMGQTAFEEFFDRGQRWLATHGKFEHDAAEGSGRADSAASVGRAASAGAAGGQHGVADITGTYLRQQMRSKFVVLK